MYHLACLLLILCAHCLYTTQAARGGALFISGTVAFTKTATFNGNTAVATTANQGGGAIYVTAAATPTGAAAGKATFFSDASFVGNKVSSDSMVHSPYICVV
jgi:hypothetical protein